MEKSKWKALAEYLQGQIIAKQGEINHYGLTDAYTNAARARVDLARLKEWERAAMIEAGENPDANPERLNPPPPPVVTIREFCLNVINSGNQFGHPAQYVWAINHGGWNQEEIGDTLERLVADGEISYRVTAGEKNYYNPLRLK